MFQGQMLDDELNLNWYGFKYRNYDPSLARFHNIDPLAEDYAYQSPYNFSENRVIDGIELEGLEWNPLQGVGSQIKQGFNNMVGSVKKTVNKAITTTKNAIQSTARSAQKFVRDNKSSLLQSAQMMQNVGDAAVMAGTTAMVVGAAVGVGVGGTPGAAVAAGGGALSLMGSILEVGVELIAPDPVTSTESIKNETMFTIIDTAANALIKGTKIPKGTTKSIIENVTSTGVIMTEQIKNDLFTSEQKAKIIKGLQIEKKNKDD